VGVTAIAAVVAVVVVSERQASVRGFLLAMGVVALVSAGEAVTVVVRAMHYSTDGVGGFCVAVLGVLATAFVIDAIPGGRAPRPQPRLCVGQAASE
jgi:hypothetical protein